MAIISVQGSSDTTSSRTKPVSLRPELNDKLPELDGQSIINESVVENTLMNNTSVNEDRFSSNSSIIAGYPEGRIIQVTYFSQNAPITDSQSKIVDLTSWTKDDVHISLTEIRNFELRLPEEMNFEYDGESNNCKMDGSALTFPGFLPKPGDFFIYGLRNGNIGIFYISSISRLAMGQETYHKITFTLQDFLTPAARDRLRKQSGDPWYFDKTKFLVGNYAMLNSTGYINQKELTQLRKEIIQNYVDRFYKSEFSSFIRPDNIYDPYVVEFWNKKISFTECHKRPVQLLIAIQNFHKTIWSAMCGNPIRNLKNVETEWNITTYVSTFWGANITSLLGNQFLTVGNEAAADKPVTIGPNGDPILVDPVPMFYNTPDREVMRARSNQAMDDFRVAFYGGFLPFRKCAPHQHPVDFPSCDPKGCIECHEVNGHDVPIKKNDPPYPILSNEELEFVWRRLKNISADAILTESQLATVRGYILWYRTTYEGTLSRKELEEEWRISASIPLDRPLTEDETAGLIAYIKSYRSAFQPVLTNREIEIMWRTRKRMSYEHELADIEMMELALCIRNYRDHHGCVPDDGYTVPVPIIGKPFTTDELKKAGALVYSDCLILGDVSLTELDKLANGIIPIPGIEPIPPDYVPTVYDPAYPKAGNSIHCHDVCHATCNTRPKDPNKQKDAPGPSYALSPAFYLGSEAMDPFEKQVYAALTNKEIDPTHIVAMIQQYLDWPDSDAFYRHLFALYLIDKSLHWLRYHS